MPIQQGAEHPEVVTVLGPFAEKFSDEDVDGMHQENVELSEPAQRFDSSGPACGQVVRLEVCESKPVTMNQAVKQRVLGAKGVGDLVNDIDSIRRAAQQSPKDQRG